LLFETGLRSFVRNSEAAAGVDVTDVVTLTAQGLNQVGNALERGSERGNIGNLRSDVDADASDGEVWLFCGLRVEGVGLRNRHTEFVLMQSGGNIRMRFRRDIGIDADGDGSTFLEVRGGLGKQG
jgi:hypothetical protein